MILKRRKEENNKGIKFHGVQLLIHEKHKDFTTSVHDDQDLEMCLQLGKA
jgi:hypothetical protein